MAPPPSPRRVNIPPLHELRFELEKGEACSIKLVNGSAEIFGFDLLPYIEHPLGDEVRAAVFSWTGAEVEMSSISTEYVAEETPVPVYFNAHLALEQLRVSCRPPPSFLPDDDPVHAIPASQQEDETLGPRVLVVGEPGSGKSTVCKSLINWAVRMGKARRDGDWTDMGDGRKVLFVNLDPSDGAFSVPGTFSAAPLAAQLPTTTPVHPFGSTHATSLPPLAQQSATAPTWAPSPSLPALTPAVSALSFFYGHTEWGRNDGLTDALLTRLGDCVRRRVDENRDEGLWRGGMIIDTPADFAKKDKHAMITRCVREFEVNVLLVVGNERLHVEMAKLMSTNKTVTVIRVPKNGGASAPEPAYKRRVQAAQIRSYFYGGPALSLGSLTPHSMSIRFGVLSVNRVGDDSASLAPVSALPIGHTRTVKDTQLVEVDPAGDGVAELRGRLCALPQIEGERRRKTAKEAAMEDGANAKKEEEGVEGDAGEEQDVDEEAAHAEDAEIAASPVMGFVHISGIDSERSKYTVLSPLPGKLPRTRLLVGSVEWQDL